MPMITTGYSVRFRAPHAAPRAKYGALSRPAHRTAAERVAWYVAVKNTEKRLRMLGFAEAEAWRLAFGES